MAYHSEEKSSFITIQQIWFATIFILNFVFGCWWLAGQWPGLFIGDTFTEWKATETGEYNLWTSYIMTFYVYAIRAIWDHPAVWSIVQLVLYCSTISMIFCEFANRLKKPILASLSLIYWLNPLFSFHIIYLNRDSINGLITLLLFFCIFKAGLYYKENNKILTLHLVLFVVFASLVSCLRKENILLLPVAIFCFLFIYGYKKAITYVLSISTLLGFLIFHVVIPHQLFGSAQKELMLLRNNYLLTTKVNQLSYILRYGYKAKLTSEESETIDKIIPLKMFDDFQDDYEIPAFHHYANSFDYTQEEYDKFVDTYWIIVRKNLKLYFENRLKMTLAIIGFHKETDFYSDNYFADYEEANLFIKNHPHYTQKVLFPKLKRYQLKFSNDFFYKESVLLSFLRIFFLTSVLGFALQLFSLVFAKKFPMFFLASLLVGIRIPAVILFAPASQFKYFYFVYLFGLLAPIFIWIEAKKSN